MTQTKFWNGYTVTAFAGVIVESYSGKWRTVRLRWPRSLMLERHAAACTCSYCRGEHGTIRRPGLWIPQRRKNGWWVIHWPGLAAKYYLRAILTT